MFQVAPLCAIIGSFLDQDDLAGGSADTKERLHHEFGLPWTKTRAIQWLGAAAIRSNIAMGQKLVRDWNIYERNLSMWQVFVVAVRNERAEFQAWLQRHFAVSTKEVDIVRLSLISPNAGFVQACRSDFEELAMFCFQSFFERKNHWQDPNDQNREIVREMYLEAFENQNLARMQWLHRRFEGKHAPRISTDEYFENQLSKAVDWGNLAMVEWLLNLFYDTISSHEILMLVTTAMLNRRFDIAATFSNACGWYDNGSQHGINTLSVQQLIVTMPFWVPHWPPLHVILDILNCPWDKEVVLVEFLRACPWLRIHELVSSDLEVPDEVWVNLERIVPRALFPDFWSTTSR